MNNTIEYQNISFQYDKKSVIFDNASIKFKKGNIYLLTGDNGTGKTTLFKILTGLYECECDIYWFGKLVNNIADMKDKIILVPENPYLYEYLTGTENVNLICEVFDIKDRDSVERNLEMFKLKPYLNKLVKEYSLGMKSKLFLSVCFSVQTDLMLFDEPFTSLDSEGQENAINQLEHYVMKGGSAVISTHISEYKEKYERNHLEIVDKKIFCKE